jgi:hypothetical protein
MVGALLSLEHMAGMAARSLPSMSLGILLQESGERSTESVIERGFLMAASNPTIKKKNGRG